MIVPMEQLQEVQLLQERSFVVGNLMETTWLSDCNRIKQFRELWWHSVSETGDMSSRLEDKSRQHARDGKAFTSSDIKHIPWNDFPSSNLLFTRVESKHIKSQIPTKSSHHFSVRCSHLLQFVVVQSHRSVWSGMSLSSVNQSVRSSIALDGLISLWINQSADESNKRAWIAHINSLISIRQVREDKTLTIQSEKWFK